MKKIVTISIISLFLVGVFYLAFAQEKEQEQIERPLRRIEERRIEKIFKEINLTEEQKEQLSKLRLEHQKEMIKLRAELQTLQLDLKPLLEPKEPDKAKVYAQIDKINKLRNEMAKKRIDFSLKRRAILTEEQWNKIKDRKSSFGFDRWHRRFPRARRFFPRLRGSRMMERRY